MGDEIGMGVRQGWWEMAGMWGGAQDGGEGEWSGGWCDCGLLYAQAVDVQMQSMALRGPDGEPQPGLESQGRAASMPRLAAETQVGGLGGSGLWEGGEWGVRRPGLGRPCVLCEGFPPAL